MITALFIDGDNINLNNIKFSLLFDKIKNNNNLIIKRVYGDWKIVQMNVFWNKQIIEHGLEEIQTPITDITIVNIIHPKCQKFYNLPAMDLKGQAYAGGFLLSMHDH